MDFRDCGKLNNKIARLISFVFRSDRMACLDRIKAAGYDDFAKEMSEKGMMTIRRS
jgi:hypothetical protein